MASNIWGFTAGWAKEQQDKVRAAAKAGRYEEALRALQEFGVYAGIASCMDLAETDRSAFEALAAQATGKPGNSWAQFYVRLVKDGCMPQGVQSMTGDFYHAARYLILLAREQKKKVVDTLWPKAEIVAKSKPFYPEWLRAYSSRRDRICAIAADHANLGPGDQKQAVLFSLGGLYTLQNAAAGTKPAIGTTCLLFVRSVLHAAGCNVISPSTSRFTCNCPNGMYAELPLKAFGYVNASEFDKPGGRRPQRGDIFHIQGENFRNRDTNELTNRDSSHVGVIVNLAGDKSWTTVEGGASDHVTRRRQRRLVEVKSEYGNWAFEDDTETTAGRRPLRGWWSIANINASQWMDGA